METLRFMKRVEKNKNRIIIPKFIVDKFGRDYYLEVNPEDGSMKLIPVKIKKGE
jgi:hypothetical protein